MSFTIVRPDARAGLVSSRWLTRMRPTTAISQFNGQEYDGRAMVVNEARPREDNRGGGGGGGRRGGGGNYGGGGAVTAAAETAGKFSQ